VDGVLSFQPSELAKLSVLFYFAQTLQNLSVEKITWLKLKMPLYVLSVVLFLVYIQPDLGTSAIIFGIVMASMWLGKVPRKITGTIMAIGALLGILGVLAVSYRGARLQTFLDIYTNPEMACNSDNQETKDRNRQVCGIRSALKRGELWGKGYGSGIAKSNGSVPEINTDGILAVIGEETGFFGTVVFLSLYIVLFWKSLQISKNAPDIAGAVLAGGIGFWITSQAFLNVGGVSGILPLKGIPLPFVSEGGSALVLNMMSIGILLNISSQSGQGNEKKAKQGRKINNYNQPKNLSSE
jgi:cell division protein FtsW (lipid II flippase)